MSAVVIGKDNPTVDGFATTGLTFNHALSAVKFVAGDDLPNCVVKSIKLDGVRYKGTYTLGTDAWTLTDDTQAFTLRLNKVVAGNGGAITEDGKGETLFMMPQTLSDDAKIEVVLNDGTADFTVGASIGGTKWEMGKTYTYHISNNFVSLVTTNDKFVAFTDETLTDQVAFFLSASATTVGTTGEILAPAGVTVTPTTFASGASNLPVKVTWPKDMGNYVSMEISFAGKKKQILMSRQTPTEGDAYWLYSLPETTSQHLENDIIGLQNASESDWIAMTSSPTYTKDNYSQVIYDNSSKGDIYLQTLSIPSANRFASLLAVKEDFSQNVMYCVEQKALTADFGFKDCERNISREAEKWNISLTGGRFKDGAQIKARIVMDAGQDGVMDDGSLTYGDDALITCTSTGGTASYVKKRWDTQENTATNNGKRTVHLQIQNANVDDDWIDLNVTGTMHDWMTWGRESHINEDFVIAHASSGVRLGDAAYGSLNKYNYCIVPLYTTCWNVHKDHPFFGTTQWQCTGNTCGDPAYMWWSAAMSKNNVYVKDVSGSSLYNVKATVRALSATNSYTYKDYIEGRLSTPGQYMYVPVQNARWYTDSEGVRYFTTSETATSFAVKYIQNRPTNDTPIEQETIYNNYRAYSDKYK